MMLPENREFDPPCGVAEPLGPGVARLLAPNASPMTFRGTNTFLLGEEAVAVIDPGPDDPDHMAAILRAVGPTRQVCAILVTHSHRDHSPLARPLSAATGAPVYAFGPSDAGRSEVMRHLSAAGLTGGGEGVDDAFFPDRTLADGARLSIGGESIEAIHTPGHMANHLSFAYRGQLFCGDLVMGWASTMVSPPDGDLSAFFDSCARLATRPETLYHPAHGAPISDGKARLSWLVAHRKQREKQILQALTKTGTDLKTLTTRVYKDVSPDLLPAAARNVLAHLIDLHGRGGVTATPHLADTALFSE